jgi:hypothetical protein
VSEYKDLPAGEMLIKEITECLAWHEGRYRAVRQDQRKSGYISQDEQRYIDLCRELCEVILRYQIK